MRTTISSLHDQRVEDIAKQYLINGYEVTTDPKSLDLPAFLKDFHPDIVAKRDGDNVVIEVKVQGKVRRTSYWGELASVIDKHPGWRFELILDTSQSAPKYHQGDPIDDIDINNRLKQSERLEAEGLLESSLLITWSAFEAAARMTLIKDEVNTNDVQAKNIIAALFSNLIIERKDYDSLQELYRLSDSIARGYKTTDITSEKIQKLRAMTRQLIQNGQIS